MLYICGGVLDLCYLFTKYMFSICINNYKSRLSFALACHHVDLQRTRPRTYTMTIHYAIHKAFDQTLKGSASDCAVAAATLVGNDTAGAAAGSVQRLLGRARADPGRSRARLSRPRLRPRSRPTSSKLPNVSRTKVATSYSMAPGLTRASGRPTSCGGDTAGRTCPSRCSAAPSTRARPAPISASSFSSSVGLYFWADDFPDDPSLVSSLVRVERER